MANPSFGGERMIEFFYSFCDRLVRIVYTWSMRRRFAGWGPKSRIEPHAKLIAPHLVLVGRHVHICEHAWLNACDDRGDGNPTLSIGDGTYIGRFAHINAWRDVVIGNNVLIADRVFISDSEHIHTDLDIPIIRQGDAYKGAVLIQDGCWLGVGCVILPGISIGRNAIIGANAVVTKSVPDFAVVAGVPAKIIRQRE